jgi:cytochrome P450
MPPDIAPDGGAALLAWFTTMRADHPVWCDAGGAYHVFRHADVHRVLTDTVSFSSNLMALSGDDAPPGTLLLTDPPEHALLRRLVSQAFTHKVIGGLATRITDVTTTLLDEIDGDEFDLVAALAYPLPIIVIAELLGVPAADRDLFRDWADKLNSARPGDEDDARGVEEAIAGLDDYLGRECRARRATPTRDLIGQLVGADVDGRRLTDEEVVNFSALLLLAGHVTTTMLLGNALLCLRQNPSAATRLRADPTLVAAAVEETLRLRPPFPKVERVSTADVEVAGTVIPAGRAVSVWVHSGNHDERQFDRPAEFDLDRGSGRHVAFGHGIHFCLGAPLARLEGEIALRLLFERFDVLSIKPDTPAPYYESGIFGVKRLVLTGHRAAVDAGTAPQR